MSVPPRIARVVDALMQQGSVEPPAVAALEPVIRSGDQFIFPVPVKKIDNQTVKDHVAQNLDPDWAVGNAPSPTLPDGSPNPDYDSDDDYATESPRHRRAYLGEFVVEWGYDIPWDRHEDFVRMLVNTEPLLIDETIKPKGVRYRGTYAVFSSSEKGMGSYRTIWSFRSLRAFQRFSTKMNETPETRFAEAVKRLKALQIQEPGAGRSQQMYQIAVSTKRTNQP
jgi:hypothetical protein